MCQFMIKRQNCYQIHVRQDSLKFGYLQSPNFRQGYWSNMLVCSRSCRWVRFRLRYFKCDPFQQNRRTNSSGRSRGNLGNHHLGVMLSIYCFGFFWHCMAPANLLQLHEFPIGTTKCTVEARFCNTFDVQGSKRGLGLLMSPSVSGISGLSFDWFHLSICTLAILPTPVAHSVFSFFFCFWLSLLSTFHTFLDFFDFFL